MKSPTPNTNLYLIGPMGSGKSSVGAQLSKLTGLKFIDSDSEIEKRVGVTIAWIFEVEKEEGFRKREAGIIAELTQEKGIILSTGGGAVLNPSTRSILHNSGTVIYLQVSPSEQFVRTSFRKDVRPLAQNLTQKELIELNSKREPLYQEIAHLQYLTDNHQPRELAKKILEHLNEIKNK